MQDGHCLNYILLFWWQSTAALVIPVLKGNHLGFLKGNQLGFLKGRQPDQLGFLKGNQLGFLKDSNL